MAQRKGPNIGVRVEPDLRAEIKAEADKRFGGNESLLMREATRKHLRMRRKLGAQYEPTMLVLPGRRQPGGCGGMTHYRAKALAGLRLRLRHLRTAGLAVDQRHRSASPGPEPGQQRHRQPRGPVQAVPHRTPPSSLAQDPRAGGRAGYPEKNVGTAGPPRNGGRFRRR